MDTAIRNEVRMVTAKDAPTPGPRMRVCYHLSDDASRTLAEHCSKTGVSLSRAVDVAVRRKLSKLLARDATFGVVFDAMAAQMVWEV